MPLHYKPLEGMAKLHFAEAFDDEFALFLRERRSPTLARMMSDSIEVEINMMSSKRGRYKVETREPRKMKEDCQASTSSNPKFDSLIKVMEKLVDRLSIDGKSLARDVPQIRNPRQQEAPPPQILQRGQKLPTNASNNNNNNSGNADQVRPPFQRNLVDEEELLHEESEEINSFGDEEDKFFLTKKQHDEQLQGPEIQIDDYQLGYHNAMIAFQRQLNLRNKDVIISEPQKKVNQEKTSASVQNKEVEVIPVVPRSGKGKEVVITEPVANKDVIITKPTDKKNHSKQKIPPQELLAKSMDKK